MQNVFPAGKAPTSLSSATPSATPTAGTTGVPTVPAPLRQTAEKSLHGDISSISTQRNVNALQAQADHGLTPAGARAFSHGQQPAFLADQTRLADNNLLAHEATHVVQQRAGL